MTNCRAGLSQLDRAGREAERAFCLEAWNGDTGYTIDRIGRGIIHVEACCMSPVGGIQPARLRSYLVDATRSKTVPAMTDRCNACPMRLRKSRQNGYFASWWRWTRRNPAQFRFAADEQQLFTDWLTELGGVRPDAQLIACPLIALALLRQSSIILEVSTTSRHREGGRGI